MSLNDLLCSDDDNSADDQSNFWLHKQKVSSNPAYLLSHLRQSLRAAGELGVLSVFSKLQKLMDAASRLILASEKCGWSGFQTLLNHPTSTSFEAH